MKRTSRRRYRKTFIAVIPQRKINAATLGNWATVMSSLAKIASALVNLTKIIHDALR